MKKSFLALCAIVLAFAACKKDEPKVTPELKLTSDAEVTVPADGGIYTVTFESNVAWTAEVNADKEIASINVTSGTAEEGKVKLTVQPLKEENATRYITVSITPEGGKAVSALFTQSGPYVPYFKVSEESLSFKKEGGTATFTIDTNIEYEVGDPTIGTCTIADGTATVTMPATTLWSSRSDRIKFTLPDIQVDVLDDEGNPTGETEAKVVRVSVAQEGYGSTSYATEFSEAVFASTSYSTAFAGDILLVANGSDKIYAYDKATGAFKQEIQAVANVTGICNDDAGNIVLMTGGAYGEGADPMVTYFIPAGTPFDASTYKAGFECNNQFYGMGYDNISANGNVLEGDALIEVFSAAGSYNVCFALKDGKRADDGQYTDYVTITTKNTIWGSKWAVARHLSADINGGLYFAGYVDNYELFYNPSMSSANWTIGCESGGAWTDGIVSMEFAEFNGHKYLVAYSYSFFVGYPSYIVLFNIDTPATPVLVDRFPVLAFEGAGSKSADISVEVVNGSLEVYIADGTQKAVIKCVLPEIK